MRIVSLVENTAVNDNIGSEHGLSLYIETNGHKILFDMGQTDLFLQNAEKLGIDLSLVDIAILSHGHYDHGGGLSEFLKVNKKAPVYISQYAFEPYHHGNAKYIGIDTGLRENNRIIITEEITKIAEGLTLYHCNDKVRKYDMGSFGLTVKKEGEYVPDLFLHEQYLFVEENGRRVLFSGCSHKGILNIAGWFEADILVGGFHFSKLPLDETLKNYADCLNQFPTDFYTCHCTGMEQFAFMKQYMKRLFYLSAGQILLVGEGWEK